MVHPTVLPMASRLLALALNAFVLAGFCAAGLVAVGPSLMGPALAAEATGYLDAVEDMPLMKGLRETGDGGIVFDKPNGRIVRALARGNVSPSDVRGFYLRTLPQLGWNRAEKLELFADLLVFRRESERLQIQAVPVAGGMTEVRFSIEPD